MHITLIPQRRDDALVVKKLNDKLTINGVAYDLSVVPEGATLPASATDCEFLVGNIERISGVLHLSLLLPHGANPPQAMAFPEPIISPANGLLSLPVAPPPPPPETMPTEPVPPAPPTTTTITPEPTA